MKKLIFLLLLTGCVNKEVTFYDFNHQSHKSVSCKECHVVDKNDIMTIKCLNCHK